MDTTDAAVAEGGWRFYKIPRKDKGRHATKITLDIVMKSAPRKTPVTPSKPSREDASGLWLHKTSGVGREKIAPYGAVDTYCTYSRAKKHVTWCTKS